MTGKERDALLEQQTELLSTIAAKLTARPRERRPAGMPKLPPRPRPQLDGLPGWDTPVPAEYVQEGDVPTVNCLCGASTVLTLRIGMECEGHCGRFFIRTRSGVKVKRFNREAI